MYVHTIQGLPGARLEYNTLLHYITAGLHFDKHSVDGALKDGKAAVDDIMKIGRFLPKMEGTEL